MNDRQDPQGAGASSPESGGEFYGYDAYGRPLYRQPRYDPQQGQYDPAPSQYDYRQAQQHPQQALYDPYAPQDPHAAQSGEQPAYDPYAAQQGQGYGYDPYGSAQQYAAPPPQQPTAYDPYDPAGRQPGQFPQPGQGPGTAAVPRQQPRYEDLAAPFAQRPEESARDPYGPASDGATAASDGPAADDASADSAYRTEQFSFVEDPDDGSEDVIDWLKFSESRTERRDERKRRGRNRTVALLVTLVIALAGGAGYLWFAGKLPGLSGSDSEEAAASGGQKRDVIVVHLREIDSDDTSTVLLVDNASAQQATTVLLPNELAITVDGSTTTLGKAVHGEGAAPTREALGTLLGAEIKGTWRLDTPYLENLVELVGGITVDANATVPGEKKGAEPLVRQGKDRELDGVAAVGYATYRAPEEPPTAQLARFGQVVEAVLTEVSGDRDSATTMVQALGQIPDPSLSEPELGATLAALAGQARKGAHRTELLPVEADGTLSEQAGVGLVKEVLGGTVKNADPDAVLRVGVKDASGVDGAADKARIALVNGGYNVVVGGTDDTVRPTSSVTYAEESQAERAKEVARALDLPAASVRRAEGGTNTDVSVVLGQDYKG